MKIILLLLSLSTSLFAMNDFPMGPDLAVTPGVLCTSPTAYRYPEKIPYCQRNVSQGDKIQIFSLYRKRGWAMTGKRDEFKIDHLIPLCAGGANSSRNLWPQHETIYVITDPLEQIGCEKLSEGKIKQKDLIALIMKGKLNLAEVPAILDQLNRL